MKLKFNKENWTGETGEIDINESTNSFIYNDLSVKLTTPEDDEFMKKEIGLESYDIVVDDERIGSVSIMMDDPRDTWTAISDSCDIHRDDDNKFIAAAKLIANIF